MELYDLKFSDTVRFSVTDIDDYNIKGTFDPQCACDTEFFGYRETAFTVSTVDFKHKGGWLSHDEPLVKEFADHFDRQLTLIVQNEIDKQNGEY